MNKEKTENQKGKSEVAVITNTFSEILKTAANFNEVFLPAPEKSKILFSYSPYHYKFSGKEGRFYPAHVEIEKTHPIELEFLLVAWQRTKSADFFKKEFYAQTSWYELLFVDTDNRLSIIAFCIEKGGKQKADNFSIYLTDIEIKYYKGEIKAISNAIEKPDFIEDRFVMIIDRYTKVRAIERTGKFGKYYIPQFEMTNTVSEKQGQELLNFIKEDMNRIPEAFTMEPI